MHWRIRCLGTGFVLRDRDAVACHYQFTIVFRAGLINWHDYFTTTKVEKQ